MGRTRHRSSSITIAEQETNYSSGNNIYESSSSTHNPAPTPSKDTRKGKKKREFPVLEEEDDEERKRQRKKGSTSLRDAIAAMAEKQYEFLEKQLVQESEIRKEELVSQI